MRRAAWTATVLVLILGGACKRGPDTEDSVRQALVQANIPSVEVVVDDDEHIVHLTEDSIRMPFGVKVVKIRSERIPGFISAT